MGQVAISDDAKFCAFTVSPTAKEAKTLRKSRQPIQTKVFVVDLAKGDKVEYEKIRSFSFSGENPGWLALHKYAPEGQAREKDKWSGSDLVLRELATGKELTFGNVAEFAFDKYGRFLAFIIDAVGQTGNGVEIRDMQSGAVLSLDNDKANYKSLSWSEKGEALACLKGKEDKAFEDKLYSAVGFTGFAGGAAKPAGIQKVVYDPKDDKSFPAGFSISPNRPAQWTEDFAALLFGISEPKKKAGRSQARRRRRRGPGRGPRGPRRPPPRPTRTSPTSSSGITSTRASSPSSRSRCPRTRTSAILAEYRVAEKKFIRLADDEVRQVVPAPKAPLRARHGYPGLRPRRQPDRPPLPGRLRHRHEDGGPHPRSEEEPNFWRSSVDGTHLLYYDDGHFFATRWRRASRTTSPRTCPRHFVNEDDDHNVVNPPDSPLGWTKDGQTVLLSDGWDIWSVPVHGGTKGVNLTVNGRKDQIRYQQIFQLDPEETRHRSLPAACMFSTYGEWTKKAGIVRRRKRETRRPSLALGRRRFRPLLKAKKAETYLFTRDTARDFPDLVCRRSDPQ